MTWGLDDWGLSPWGLGGLDSSFQVVSAYANTDRSVLVEFNVEPLQRSSIGIGDALNPLTWVVSSNGRGLLPMVVTRLTGTRFEVRTLQLLDPWLHDVTVSSSSMLDAGGAATAPFAYVVAGAHAGPIDLGAAARYVDAANPPFVGGQPGGQVQISSGGDYQNETGAALLRKLVVRFLTTDPGELYALPDYGIGLRSKEPLATADLVQMRLRIERGLLRWIPGADAVGVRISLAGGVLTVMVQVRTVSGSASESVSIPVDGSIQL